MNGINLTLKLTNGGEGRNRSFLSSFPLKNCHISAATQARTATTRTSTLPAPLLTFLLTVFQGTCVAGNQGVKVSWLPPVGRSCLGAWCECAWYSRGRVFDVLFQAPGFLRYHPRNPVLC